MRAFAAGLPFFSFPPRFDALFDARFFLRFGAAAFFFRRRRVPPPPLPEWPPRVSSD
jgi:hypothetical protein